jgi:hypothetical protein
MTKRKCVRYALVSFDVHYRDAVQTFSLARPVHGKPCCPRCARRFSDYKQCLEYFTSLAILGSDLIGVYPNLEAVDQCCCCLFVPVVSADVF